MDRIKKFINDKKVSKNFKRAGVGHRLTSENVPDISLQTGPQKSSQITSAERIASADIAAQAAFKRMNLGAKQESTTQRNIRIRAMKELEQERIEKERMEKGLSADASSETTRKRNDDREFEHSNALEGVYFTCELLGEDLKLKKSDMKERVEEFLLMQLDDDSIIASTLMIFSLNPIDKRELASETLQKYLRNLLEHPEEKKYQRIRLNNKVFEERIMPVKGGKEFLCACGFKEKDDVLDDGTTASFLIISEADVNNTQLLIQALELLQTKQAVPLKLDRNAAVYKLKTNQNISQPRIPDDFFNVSASEIKKEQTRKELDAEKMLMLRTREMRERDSSIRKYTYKYTLLRIKFPNQYFLQGTFGSEELFQSVRDFVEQYLTNVEPLLFILKDSITGKSITDGEKCLNDLKLTPTAILHFEWDPDILHGLACSENQKVPYLEKCYEDKAEDFVLA